MPIFRKMHAPSYHGVTQMLKMLKLIAAKTTIYLLRHRVQYAWQ
jgi:hypothetical protein